MFSHVAVRQKCTKLFEICINFTDDFHTIHKKTDRKLSLVKCLPVSLQTLGSRLGLDLRLGLGCGLELE